jgi:CRP/FNR family transcriptional regulator, cyclic AMP receptor protein
VMQGVVGEHLHVVAEGNVEVAKRGENNDETVLVTLGRGDCFGEMSILTGEITSAEVRAKGPTAVLMLHREQLEGMLLKRPVLSREFSKLLAERLKATNQSLQSELSRGILGKLSMISLVDLVQTLNQSRRTGTLVLTYFGQQARLGFRNGQMSTAICGEFLGEEAFFTVVCWPDGDFCFEQAEPAADAPGKVKTDIMGLMMEGMRRMDEARIAAKAQPPPSRDPLPTPAAAPAPTVIADGGGK